MTENLGSPRAHLYGLHVFLREAGSGQLDTFEAENARRISVDEDGGTPIMSVFFASARHVIERRAHNF